MRHDQARARSRQPDEPGQDDRGVKGSSCFSWSGDRAHLTTCLRVTHQLIRRRAFALCVAALAIALLTAAHAAEARTFGWKATGKGGVVYLVGSIHVMTPDFYPLHPSLEAAFKESDLLVEEVDMARDAGPGARR